MAKRSGVYVTRKPGKPHYVSEVGHKLVPEGRARVAIPLSCGHLALRYISGANHVKFLCTICTYNSVHGEKNAAKQAPKAPKLRAATTPIEQAGEQFGRQLALRLSAG